MAEMQQETPPQAGSPQWNNQSGNAYISARMRGESYPYFNPQFNVKISYHKLRVASPTRCDHGESICATKDCVEGWGLGDWRLFLRRTGAGRRFLKELNLTVADMEMLEGETFPSVRHLPSCDGLHQTS
jgi:hypothetical protein